MQIIFVIHEAGQHMALHSKLLILAFGQNSIHEVQSVPLRLRIMHRAQPMLTWLISVNGRQTRASEDNPIRIQFASGDFDPVQRFEKSRAVLILPVVWLIAEPFPLFPDHLKENHAKVVIVSSGLTGLLLQI
jgi:hypothetical protein